MIFLRVLFIAFIIMLPVPVAAVGDYGYPIADAYEATILGTPANLMPNFPESVHTKQLVIHVLPNRQKPPLFYYDEGVRCTFAYQEKKAPLVFLIPGTGSSDRAPKIMTMMKAFYHAGFHVITLPSPSNANFIISASRSGVPGDLAEDASDLCRVMEEAWKEVAGDIEVTSFNLCGYSLGASQAAFVAKLDDERHLFGFRRVLMINPPVSLYSSMARIEGLLRSIPGGPKKEGIFFNRMLDKFSRFYRYGNFVAINDEFLYAIFTSHLFSHEETGGLIGLTFRINLAGMIFSSDVMTNSGYVVPKNRVLSPTDSLYDYFMVSTHLSFFNYFNEYFYPHFRKLRPEITKEELIDSEDLKSIGEYLKSADKIGVMTNENDFILTGTELDYLRTLFAGRITIYPCGGHLGNLEYSENLERMVAFFR